MVGYFEFNHELSGFIKPLYCQDCIQYQCQVNTLCLNVYQAGLLYLTAILGVGKIPMKAKVENIDVHS